MIIIVHFINTLTAFRGNIDINPPHVLYPPHVLCLILLWFCIVHADLIFRIHCRWGARWLSGRVSDSGARGPGFETYRRRVVSLSKTLYSPKVLVNYPGSDGSVPT